MATIKKYFWPAVMWLALFMFIVDSYIFYDTISAATHLIIAFIALATTDIIKAVSNEPMS